MRRLLILLAFPLVLGAAHDLSSRAKANLGALVTDADYPPSAIRAEAQGIVGFTLDVDKDGRVTNCAIVSSSGSAVLDQATCRIMTARAQFVPAHDRKGRPTTDRVWARIKWVLPQADEEDDNEAAPQP
jgi:protein TonB